MREILAKSSRVIQRSHRIVRERLARDGVVHGPALQTGRLASRGFTSAEKALARNYQTGDVVGFHRPYKRLGVEKGDELRVAGVDRAAGTVMLAGEYGRTVAWEPGRIAARAGGVEVYKREAIELRAGDHIRWTRNDAGLGLVNSQTAEVTAVNDGRAPSGSRKGAPSISMPAIRSFATPTGPGPRPCTRSRAAPSTT